MKSFLEQTAHSIVEHIEWSQLSNTTLVLPSHRAGMVLKNELMRLQQEQGRKAIWSPDVKTLTQLQDALSPLYAEDELFTIVRLYRHYCRLNEGDTDLMPLDMFYGWGRQMIADFTNVDASMPAEQVPAFFDNAIAANTLEKLQLDKEIRERLNALINPNAQHGADSIYSRYAVIWDQLYELYKALHDELAAEQKGYAGMRQRAVIEAWNDESVQNQITGRTYIFVGFNYLLPVERELMEKLKANGQAMFYWDFVPDFQTNNKAFHFARLNSSILGNSAPETAAFSQAQFPKDITVMACPSRESQAQFVHQWLLANYTAHGQKVGVVICDESMLESVIYTIPAITLEGETEPEPVNITKGFPLRNTAVYARTLAWLYDKKNGQAEDLVAPEVIDGLLEALFPENPENPDTPETPDSSDSSDTMNWKDLLILESEYQVRKIANQMRLLITNGLGDVPFTLKLLRLLMRRTMENVTMPFHGEPITDIQIMGVLETRMLDFDKLLILNADEGVIPQHQTDNSFIPYYLRKAYSMQTPDEKATIYAYNFFRLISRTGHATVLYTTTEGAENSKGMSRFVMQMLYSPEFQVEKQSLQEPNILPDIDDARLGTSGKTFASIHPNHLSPSAINTYIDCPRKFCLQYIQGLKGEEKEDVQFTPAELGTYVHASMEYLYKHYLGCDNTHPVRVTPEQIAAISDSAHLEEALLHAYEQVGKHVPVEHLSENEIIMRFVLNILERDQADAEVGLQIYLLEAPRYFQMDVEGIGPLRIGGIIDRLDIYGPEGQEKIRVVDYKSGGYNAARLAASTEQWMEQPEKNYVRQTLMYSHAVMVNEALDLPIEPNLFFCSHKLTDLPTTVKVDKAEVTNYRDIQDTFLPALQAKIQEIATVTEFPPCEESKCKSFCPFLTLCHRTVRPMD